VLSKRGFSSVTFFNVFILLLLAGCSQHRKPVQRLGIASLPPVMLWAWERPEDLRFIDTTTTGVAFLAETLEFRNGMMREVHRRQPLRMSRGTKVVPVVRIESGMSDIASEQHESPMTRLDSNECKMAAQSIVDLVYSLRSEYIQIDFDAVQSERAWYADLLRRVRADLPPKTEISITALASWCYHDSWIDSLAADEAVPMLFRLGIAQASVTSYLRSNGEFTATKTAGVVGVSTDEELPGLPPHSRLYLFTNHSWSPESLKHVLSHYHENSM
jgi:hypothetical protein